MNPAAQRVLQHFQESIAAKQQCAEQLAEPTARAAALLLDSLMADGKILVCGNGGSAADAQHFAAELTGRFEKERMPLGAIALTTDTSALTAIGNDYAFDQIFARQVSALGRPGDVLVAISTSGNSGNVLAAIEAAREHGITTVKYFPAEASGGLKMLKALLAPYAMLQVMPTGGIGTHNIRDYLALKNVIACGGSWMVEKTLLDAQNWEEIARLAREAVALVQGD